MAASGQKRNLPASSVASAKCHQRTKLGDLNREVFVLGVHPSHSPPRPSPIFLASAFTILGVRFTLPVLLAVRLRLSTLIALLFHFRWIFRLYAAGDLSLRCARSF
jgi:hypothetical protein